MPTEVAEAITQKTKTYAKQQEKILMEFSGVLGPKHWTAGFAIVEVEEKNLWQVLGFETRNAFRVHVRVGRSTWFRTRRLTQEIAAPLLKKELLTRKGLDRLTLENAEHLLRLPEKKRWHESWITKALTMNEEQFEAAVDEAVENGDEQVVDSTESRALLKFHCTSGQKEMILDGIHGFAKKHGIPVDEEARSLELLIAEVKGCQSCGWE